MNSLNSDSDSDPNPNPANDNEDTDESVEENNSSKADNVSNSKSKSTKPVFKREDSEDLFSSEIEDEGIREPEQQLQNSEQKDDNEVEEDDQENSEEEQEESEQDNEDKQDSNEDIEVAEEEGTEGEQQVENEEKEDDVEEDDNIVNNEGNIIDSTQSNSISKVQNNNTKSITKTGKPIDEIWKNKEPDIIKYLLKYPKDEDLKTLNSQNKISKKKILSTTVIQLYEKQDYYDDNNIDTFVKSLLFYNDDKNIYYKIYINQSKKIVENMKNYTIFNLLKKALIDKFTKLGKEDGTPIQKFMYKLLKERYFFTRKEKDVNIGPDSYMVEDKTLPTKLKEIQNLKNWKPLSEKKKKKKSETKHKRKSKDKPKKKKSKNNKKKDKEDSNSEKTTSTTKTTETDKEKKKKKKNKRKREDDSDREPSKKSKKDNPSETQDDKDILKIKLEALKTQIDVIDKDLDANNKLVELIKNDDEKVALLTAVRKSYAEKKDLIKQVSELQQKIVSKTTTTSKRKRDDSNTYEEKQPNKKLKKQAKIANKLNGRCAFCKKRIDIGQQYIKVRKIGKKFCTYECTEKYT